MLFNAITFRQPCGLEMAKEFLKFMMDLIKFNNFLFHVFCLPILLNLNFLLSCETYSRKKDSSQKCLTTKI